MVNEGCVGQAEGFCEQVERCSCWCVGSTTNIVLCCVTIVNERGRERAVCVFTMAVRAKKRSRERVCVLVKVRRG